MVEMSVAPPPPSFFFFTAFFLLLLLLLLLLRQFGFTIEKLQLFFLCVREEGWGVLVWFHTSPVNLIGFWIFCHFFFKFYFYSHAMQTVA